MNRAEKVSSFDFGEVVNDFVVKLSTWISRPDYEWCPSPAVWRHILNRKLHNRQNHETILYPLSSFAITTKIL